MVKMNKKYIVYVGLALGWFTGNVQPHGHVWAQVRG